MPLYKLVISKVAYRKFGKTSRTFLSRKKIFTTLFSMVFYTSFVALNHIYDVFHGWLANFLTERFHCEISFMFDVIIMEAITVQRRESLLDIFVCRDKSHFYFVMLYSSNTFDRTNDIPTRIITFRWICNRYIRRSADWIFFPWNRIKSLTKLNIPFVYKINLLFKLLLETYCQLRDYFFITIRYARKKYAFLFSAIRISFRRYNNIKCSLETHFFSFIHSFLLH